jgi:peptide/nickel transport system ATP-binding protein
MIASNHRDPVIRVEDLTMWFPVRRGLIATLLSREPQQYVRAVNEVSFAIGYGEILGVVGESGSGKTTLGMTTLRLYEPTRGAIEFRGRDITALAGSELRAFRRGAQIVFQNPYESLNARFTVFDSVVEPLHLHRIGDAAEKYARVLRAMERAELQPADAYLWRYPHELSGGQLQRVAIARAIVLEPALLVADEPVSMLDVSIRAGVLNLLKRLSDELGTAILYISHDLTTVRYICQRTAVMYAGCTVEVGETETVLRRPLHPYTQLLIRAVPRVSADAPRERVLLEGDVPSLVNPPRGCRFHPRCPAAMAICREQAPPLREVEPGHWAACHLY